MAETRDMRNKALPVELAWCDGFDAVGLHWEGTYADAAAGKVRSVIRAVQDRRLDIPGGDDARRLFGISWNDRPDGFRYFVGIPVAADAATPDGLSRVRVPRMRCACLDHGDGDATGSYRRLFDWMAERGIAHDTSALSLVDDYPIDTDPHAVTGLRLRVPVAADSVPEMPR